MSVLGADERSLVSRIPIRKIVSVPTTMIMFVFSVLLKKAYRAGMRLGNVIHKITKTPIMEAINASWFLVCLLMMPNKNRPSMPAAKIPESCHHTSKMLLTPIMAMPVPMPKMPNTTVAICSMFKVWRSLISGFI